mgnify:CR=1 FL=1
MSASFENASRRVDSTLAAEALRSINFEPGHLRRPLRVERMNVVSAANQKGGKEEKSFFRRKKNSGVRHCRGFHPSREGEGVGKKRVSRAGEEIILTTTPRFFFERSIALEEDNNHPYEANCEKDGQWLRRALPVLCDIQ